MSISAYSAGIRPAGVPAPSRLVPAAADGIPYHLVDFPPAISPQQVLLRAGTDHESIIRALLDTLTLGGHALLAGFRGEGKTEELLNAIDLATDYQAELRMLAELVSAATGRLLAVAHVAAAENRQRTAADSVPAHAMAG